MENGLEGNYQKPMKVKNFFGFPAANPPIFRLMSWSLPIIRLLVQFVLQIVIEAYSFSNMNLACDSEGYPIGNSGDDSDLPFGGGNDWINLRA